MVAVQLARLFLCGWVAVMVESPRINIYVSVLCSHLNPEEKVQEAGLLQIM